MAVDRAGDRRRVLSARAGLDDRGDPIAILAAIGFIGGILGGLLGVGGGFILVPLQVMWARVGQREAQANSLAAIVPISVVGVLVYHFGARPALVDWRFALLLAAGGALGAYLGGRVMVHLPERRLRQVFAILLLLLGVKELIAP